MRPILALVACLAAAPALGATPIGPPVPIEAPLAMPMPALRAPQPLSGAFAGARVQQISAITLGAVGGSTAIIGMFAASVQTPAQTWGWMASAGLATGASVVLFSTTRLTARSLGPPSDRHRARGITATVVTLAGIGAFSAGFLALELSGDEVGLGVAGVGGVLIGLTLFPIGVVASGINTGRILDEVDPNNNWGEVTVAPLLLPDGGGLALAGRL